MTRDITSGAANPDKTTPVGADKFPIVDTETAPNSLKEITFTNVAAWLASLVQTLTNKVIALGSNTISGTKAEFNTAMTDADFATLAGAETLSGPKTLTAPVIADFTAAQHDHGDADDGGAIVRGYTLTALCASTNPVDATTYYFGSLYTVTLVTGAQLAKVLIPVSGTVIKITLFFRNVGTGSAEASTISFRYDDTTDTAISAVVDNSNAVQSIFTTVSIAVVADHYFEIKWVTPTWATNPTAVMVAATVFISTP